MTDEAHNYDTKLMAWAIEMAIKAGSGDVLATARTYVDACYNADKAFEDRARRLFEMVAKMPPNASRIEELKNELDYIAEQRIAQRIDDAPLEIVGGTH